MKNELQQKLLSKYPEFFQKDLKIYTGEKPLVEEVAELVNQKEMVLPIQFGFECGDGWYVILDTLMGEIQHYLKYHNEGLDRKFKYQFLWDLQRWLRLNCRKKGSWKEKLAEWIYDKAPKGGYPHLSIQVTQIKEKFGGLCFYYFGGNKEISGMVRLAESLSYRICEYCGTTQNVGMTQGWICVICKDCHEKNERANHLIWGPRKDS
jgi:hypothetical protein